MIQAIKQTRYVGICDNCGWKTSPSHKESIAARYLSFHKCGEHREAHDSTGGFRGILGGYNRRCVCGAHYVSESSSEPFQCPKGPQ